MKHWTQVFVVSLCVLTPVVGHGADAFVLRAEDTPGETRIEMNIADAAFAVERPEAGVVDLVTPDLASTFDIMQIISGGKGSRVANARLMQEDDVNRLRLILNCDCIVDVNVSSGMLAIDIKDPQTTDKLSSAEQTDEEIVEGAATAQKIQTGPRPAPTRSPAPAARPTEKATASLFASSSKPAQGASKDKEKQSGIETDQTVDKAVTDEVTLARDHLLQQLSRAADQGLIQFVSDAAAAQAPAAENTSPKQADKNSDGPESFIKRPVTPDVAPPDEEKLVASPPPQPVEIPVRARTAIDKDFRVDRAETRIAVAFCIDPSRLNLSEWTQERPFLDTTLSLRSELLDEFDQPKPAIASKLTRHYILHGFGAEAEQMLGLYGDVINNREVLADLARIVDLRPPQPLGPIARTAPCHAHAALWRRIAGLPDGRSSAKPPQGAAAKAIFDGQMLDEFAKLPVPLRQQLGPQLMKNLIDKGAIDAAEQLDLILLRSPVVVNEALTLSRARLLGVSGRLAEAERLYQQLSQSNRPEAQMALILLLESRMNRKAGGSPELSDALADAAFTARDSAMEVPLKVAEIRSRAMSDGASSALGVLLKAIERAGGESDLLRDVGHAVLEQISPVDDDPVDYAKAVTMLGPYISAGLAADPARRRVAEELIGLGLPNLALEYLEPARQRASPKTRLITAEAMLAIGKADGALAELENQTGERAMGLRITALEQLGKFDRADRLARDLSQQGKPRQAARAMRAGNWKEAAAAGARPRRLLAAYMASQDALDEEAAPAANETDFLTPPKVDDETTLESVRSVVDASKSARSIIQEALEDG